MEQGYRIIDIDIEPFYLGFLERISYLVKKPIDSLHNYHNIGESLYPIDG